MSCLEQLSQPRSHPSHQYTTIVLHRHDSDDPITHRLQGLWTDEALYFVLAALVQEYYDPELDTGLEIVWQDGEDEWAEILDMVFDVRTH
jgi:hypothetical protein